MDFFGFEGLFFSSNQLIRLDKADKAFVFCVNLPLFSKATVERAHLSMEQHYRSPFTTAREQTDGVGEHLSLPALLAHREAIRFAAYSCHCL